MTAKPKDGGGLTEEKYPKLSYVKEFKEWGWVIGSGIYIDDLNAAFVQTVLKDSIYIVPLIVVLFSRSKYLAAYPAQSEGLFLLFPSLRILLPKGEADLRVKIKTKTKNELNQIADAVNIFIEAIRNTIEHAKMTALENASVSTELVQTSLNIGRRAEEEAKTINHIFEDAKAIINDVTDLAKSTEESKVNFLEANKALQNSKAELSKMVEAVQGRVQVEMEFAQMR